VKPDNSTDVDDLLVIKSPWLRILYAIFSRDGFFAFMAMCLMGLLMWTIIDREKVNTQQAVFNQKMVDLLEVVHEDHGLIVANQSKIIDNQTKVLDIDDKIAVSLELLTHIVDRIDERDVHGGRK